MQNRILRLNEVIQLTGLSRSSIYSFMAQGSFPTPIKLGARAVGWNEGKILEWLSQRPYAR